MQIRDWILRFCQGGEGRWAEPLRLTEDKHPGHWVLLISSAGQCAACWISQVSICSLLDSVLSWLMVQGQPWVCFIIPPPSGVCPEHRLAGRQAGRQAGSVSLSADGPTLEGLEPEVRRKTRKLWNLIRGRSCWKRTWSSTPSFTDVELEAQNREFISKGHIPCEQQNLVLKTSLLLSD